MVFKRLIERELYNWKSKSDRKPLILRGARQVGKTTLIENFSSEYRFKIFLNLELEKDRIFFSNTDDIKDIVETLFLSSGISVKNISDTLLFIDEIQEEPKAIKMLRYFYEEFPELNVIAAGSLLEFALNNIKSFPVGRVEYLYLHPLNFEEFLIAKNNELAIEYFNQIPVKQISHNVLLDLYNEYIIVGGMPEIVKNYVKDDSLSTLQNTYESIWQTYKDDVNKYSKNDSFKKIVRFVLESAPLFMDQRIKYQNFGKSNYKSREVGEAFRKLDDAKILRILYPTTDFEFPLKNDFRKSPILQFLDTGMLNYILELQASLIGVDDLSDSYKGAIIPHIIRQELISKSNIKEFKPKFWVREKNQSSSEVDIIYTYKNNVYPIEVKSGKTGTLRSLHQFIDISKSKYAVRIYGGKFNIQKTKTPKGTEFYLMNLPYFLSLKLDDYLEYMLSEINL